MRPFLMAEFAAPEAMLAALRALRRRGYRKLDAFTPYPVHGVDAALGLRRSPLTWIVLPAAIVGVFGGYGVQWLCNAVLYPLDVGGRPPHSAPAFVPITFEMGVLLAALTGVVAFFVLCGLPRLHHPIFEVDRFERASIDRFWISVAANDPAFELQDLTGLLEQLGALGIVPPEAEVEPNERAE